MRVKKSITYVHVAEKSKEESEVGGVQLDKKCDAGMRSLRSSYNFKWQNIR